MKKVLNLLFMVIIATAFLGCSYKNVENKELTVSAAASLTELMEEVKPMFEKEYGAVLTVNLASSGTLQKQIEEGAPVDVFISASSSKMDALAEKGLIDDSSRIDLLKNQVVLIVSTDSEGKVKSLEDLKKGDVKVSIGEPSSVPAGKYGKESLEYYKVWDDIKDKLIFAKNVKQVVSYIESGEVDAGIIYKSDATLLKNSIIVKKLEPESHKAIVYPAAIIKSSMNSELAEKFIEFFEKDEVKKIVEKYNFEI